MRWEQLAEQLDRICYHCETIMKTDKKKSKWQETFELYQKLKDEDRLNEIEPSCHGRHSDATHKLLRRQQIFQQRWLGR